MAVRCEICRRPDGADVCVLEHGPWRLVDADQWHDSQGVEVDLIPLETHIDEETVEIAPVWVGDKTMRLCGHCREAFGDGSPVDEDGQGLLV